MSVDFRLPQYEDAALEWQMISDSVKGSHAIKSGGEAYLPRPNPQDNSTVAMDRYAQYKARAVFFAATQRTMDGLVGAAFRRWPTLSIPAGIDYLENDADGSGVNLYQQSQSVVAGVLQFGRYGLLADYPPVDEIVTRSQMGLYRAHIRAIAAPDIINWRTEVVGGLNRLSLVVIAESVVVADGFESSLVDQRRVLKLEDGVYMVELWRKSKREEWELYSASIPAQSNGSSWDEIPFSFVGAENNEASIDRSPLQALADLNIAHYRNSADYEDSVFFVGQVQPWITGLTAEWRDYLESSGMFIGSRAPLLLPEGSQFGMSQALPNMIAKEAMDAKERQMIQLGARLIEPMGQARTATEVDSTSAAQHSVLSLVVGNVSDAYTKAIGYAARFMGADGEIEYTISSDFVEHKLDAQMLTALIAAWQSGRLPSSDLWSQLRKFGVIDASKTDDEINDELEMTGAGLVLDGNE